MNFWMLPAVPLWSLATLSVIGVLPAAWAWVTVRLTPAMAVKVLEACCTLTPVPWAPSHITASCAPRAACRRCSGRS
jgi:hypothetical protein